MHIIQVHNSVTILVQGSGRLAPLRSLVWSSLSSCALCESSYSPSAARCSVQLRERRLRAPDGSASAGATAAAPDGSR